MRENRGDASEGGAMRTGGLFLLVLVENICKVTYEFISSQSI